MKLYSYFFCSEKLEESRNAAIETFISREKRRADFAKRNLDRAQDNIAHLEKLK